MNLEILVISLPGERERRRRVQAQLAGCPVPWTFIDAVRGSELPAPAPEYDDRTRMMRVGYPMSGGEIGCFLSHRVAWRTCVANAAPALVAEDDFELVADLDHVLGLTHRYLSRCDVLRLQGLHPRAGRVLERSGNEQLVWELTDPRGSAGYVVSPQAAARLLQLTDRFWVAVDDFFARDWEHGLNVFSVWPYPICVTPLPSTISGRVKPALSPWARLRRELYRAPDSLRNRAKRQWKRLGPVSRLGVVPGTFALGRPQR
jgi:glycosyl transferase, family 25